MKTAFPAGAREARVGKFGTRLLRGREPRGRGRVRGPSVPGWRRRLGRALTVRAPLRLVVALPQVAFHVHGGRGSAQAPSAARTRPSPSRSPAAAPQPRRRPRPGPAGHRGHCGHAAAKQPEARTATAGRLRDPSRRRLLCLSQRPRDPSASLRGAGPGRSRRRGLGGVWAGSRREWEAGSEAGFGGSGVGGVWGGVRGGAWLLSQECGL